MNNGSTESLLTASRPTRVDPESDEDNLTRTKRELLQAEVRLAKARATLAGAEIDVKVLKARLKSLA